MIVDFELAAISSFELEFPLTNVKGLGFSLDTALIQYEAHALARKVMLLIA